MVIIRSRDRRCQSGGRELTEGRTDRIQWGKWERHMKNQDKELKWEAKIKIKGSL